jgi:hypothetical protein
VRLGRVACAWALFSTFARVCADTSVTVARAADALALHPAEGPFPTLERFCEKELRNSSWDGSCWLERPLYNCALGVTRPPRGGAFLEVRTVSVKDNCYVAMRTAAGWFVEAIGLVGRVRESISVPAAEVTAQGPDGSAELLVRVRHTSWAPARSWAVSELNQGTALFCGVSAAGAPACTGQLPLEWRDSVEGERQARRAWRMDAELRAEGGLALRLVDGRRDFLLGAGPSGGVVPPGRYHLRWLPERKSGGDSSRAGGQGNLGRNQVAATAKPTPKNR